MALISTLVDSFGGATLSNYWSNVSTGTGTYTVGSGTLNLSGGASSDALARVQSQSILTFNNSSIFVRMDPGASNATSVQIQLLGSSSAQVSAAIVAGQLVCTSTDTTGATTFNQSITYDPFVMAYVRLRSSGTVLYFDTSPDAITWTTAVTNGTYSAGAGDIWRAYLNAQWTGVTPNANPAKFDDCNIAAFDKFTDDFPNAALDAAKWGAPTFSNGGTVTVSGGLLSFTGTTANSVCTLYSVGRSIADSYLYAKVDIGTSSVSEVVLTIAPVIASNEQITASLTASSNKLYMQVINAAGQINYSSSVPYVPATMQYWRLRSASAAAAIELHTSVDGVTWTLRHSSSLTVASTAYYRLMLQTTWSGVTPTGPVTFDLVNGGQLVPPNTLIPTGIADAETFGPPNYTPLLEFLTDDFTASPIDATKWTVTSSNGGTPSIVNAALSIATTANSQALGRVRSNAQYTIGNGSYVLVKHVRDAVAGAAYSCSFKVNYVNDGSATGGATIVNIAANIGMYCYDALSNGITAVDIPYSSSAHAWIRLRFDVSGNNVTSYLDVSANGTNWTQLGISATRTWTAPLAYVTMDAYNNGAAAARTSTFDKLNLPPPQPPLTPTSINDAEAFGAPTLVPPLMETLQDDFSDPTASALNWTPTGTVTYTSGAAVMSGSGNKRFDSQSSFKIDTSTNFTYIAAKVTRVSSVGSLGTDMRVYNPSGNMTAAFQIVSNSLQVFIYNDSNINVYNVTVGAYNSAAMAYLRIRTAANAVHFGYSSNAVTWTETSYTGTFGVGIVAKVYFLHTGTAASDKTTIDNVNILAYDDAVAPTSLNDVQTFGQPSYKLPIENLREYFEGTTFDANVWSTGATSATVACSGGAAVVSLQATMSSVGQIYSKSGGYQLVDSSVFARVIHSTDTKVATQFSVKPSSGSEYFQARITGGVLSLTISNGFDIVGSANPTYDPVAHAWLKIRHTGTIVYMETSPDGLTWAVGAQATHTPTADQYFLDMRALWQVSPTGPAEVKFDNVNVLPTPLIHTLKDTFDVAQLDAAKWAPTSNGGAGYGISGGKLILGVPNGTPGSVTVKSVNSNYTFNESYVLMKVKSDGGTATNKAVKLTLSSSSSQELFSITQSGGQHRFLGTNSSGGSLANILITIGAEQIWWRIRHTGTVVYWETSPDAVAWIVQAQATYTPNFNKAVELNASNSTGAGVDWLNGEFDNVNTVPPLIETLIDTFEGTTLDATKWSTGVSGTVTFTVSGGTLKMIIGSGGVSPRGWVTTVDSFTFVGSSFLAQVIPDPTNLGADIEMRLAAGNEAFYFTRRSSTLYFTGIDSFGTTILNTSGSYSSTTDAWWRLRNTGTVVYWETAPNGLAWTVRGQVSYTPARGPYAAWLTTSMAPGSPSITQFDNVNVALRAPTSINDVQTFGAPTLQYQLLEALKDDFSDPTASAARWTTAATTAGNTVAVDGKTFTITTSGGASGVVGDLRSVNGFRFNGSAIYAQVFPDTTATTQRTYLRVVPSGGGSESFYFYTSGTFLYCTGYNTAGAALTSISPTYDAYQHAWWRIRSTGGTVYWETSVDGFSWAVQTQVSYTPASAQYNARLSSDWTGASSASVVRFDNVNIVPMALLQDGFNPSPGTLDTTKWSTAGTTGSTVNISASGGRLSVGTTAGLVAPIGSLRSNNSFTFTGSSLHARVIPDATATNQQVYLRVVPLSGNEVFYFVKLGTGLSALGYDVNGVQLNTVNLTYDPVAHAWWRIRSTGGTVYWETSPEGIFWTVCMQSTYTPQAEPYRAQLYTQWSGTSTAGTVQFDNVNLVPMAALQDDFSSGSLDLSKWTTVGTTISPASIVAVSKGALEISTLNGYAPVVGSARSIDGFAFAESSVFVRVMNTVPSANQNVYLQIVPAVGGSERYNFRKTGSTIIAEGFNASNQSIFPYTSITYDPVAHAWWRIRHSDALLYFETSPDAVTWTNRFGPIGFTPPKEPYQVRLFTDWNANTTAATVRFDNLNVLVAPAPLESLADDFSTAQLDTAKWISAISTVGVVTVSGGVLNCTASTTAGLTGVRSVDSFTLASPSPQLSAKVTHVGGTGMTHMWVKRASGGGIESRMRIYNGALQFFDNPSVLVSGITYDPVAHAWLRMRFSVAGTDVTTYFDTSPNGMNWTQRAVSASIGWGALTCNVELVLQSQGSSGTSTFDNVNVFAVSAAPTSINDAETFGAPFLTFNGPLLETLQDNFSDSAASIARWTPTGTVNFSGGNAYMVGSTTKKFLSQSGFNIDTDTKLSQLTAKLTFAGSGSFSSDMGVYDASSLAGAILRISNSTSLQALIQDSAGTIVYNVIIGSYNPPTMPYLRIRTTSGKVGFGYSKDRVNWTETTYYTGSFGVGAPMKAGFVHYGTSASHATTVDDVNIPRPPLLETLTDDFSVPATSATKWTPTGTVSYASGAAVMSGSGTSQLDSQGTYAFDTDSQHTYVAAKVTPTGGSFYVDMRVYDTGGAAQARFRITDTGAFSAQLTASGGGVMFDQALGTYNPATMAYLRIRTSSNAVHFGYSANGITWTENTWSGVFGFDALTKVQFIHYGTAAAHTTTVDNVNFSVVSAAPDGINDPETLGDPTASSAATVNPDGINDPETLGDPELVDTPGSTPDGINDPETLGDPVLVETPDSAPDGINDPESLGDPTLAATDVINPDGLIDPETLGAPALGFVPPSTPNSIIDPETLGAPTLAFAPLLMPDGILDPETLGAPAVTYPPIHTMYDSFDGNSLNTVLWNNDPTTVITKSVSGGRLYFNVVAAANSNYYAGIYHVGNYNFKDSYVSAQVTPITSSTVPLTVFGVYGNNGENFYFQKSGTTLFMRAFNSQGTSQLNASVVYSAGTHVYWRIRHSGTTIFWETAQFDRGPWTAHRQITYTGPLASGHYANIYVNWVGTPAVTSAWVDNFNNIPSYSAIDSESLGAPAVMPVGRPMELLQDAFSVDPMDGATWSPGTVHGGTSVSTAGGQLAVFLASGRVIPYFAGANSIEAFDLNNSYILAKVTTIAATNTATQLVVRNPVNTKEYFSIGRQGAQLQLRAFDANGVAKINTFTTWVASPTMDWWRIRHTDGNIFLETSADSFIWAWRGVVEYTPSSRALRASLEANLISGTSTNVTANFDNVNVVTYPRPASITDPETFEAPEITFAQFVPPVHSNMALM